MQENEPKISHRVVPVTDELMNTAGVMIGSSVMLHSSCHEGRTSHNTARRGSDGRWYVRKGKRGCVVRYLTQCEITYFDGEASLYQFKTDYLVLVEDFERRLKDMQAQRDKGLLHAE